MTDRDCYCERHTRVPRLGTVCRLGLATRGNTHLEPDAVEHAIDRGINYLNWCGHADGMSAAVRRLGDRRRNVFVAVQMYAHTRDDAARELGAVLGELGTDYVDVVTFFYMESDDEWREITSADGAYGLLKIAQAEGKVHAIGVTQSPAAAVARDRRNTPDRRGHAAL